MTEDDAPAALYCALFWIQGKTVLVLRFSSTALYCALFWIQGKTQVHASRLGKLLYCALFWIQGKTSVGKCKCSMYCTVPYFGFKAKPAGNGRALTAIVLCLILDSRQNFEQEFIIRRGIVLCLILDSRQNRPPRGCNQLCIVLCLILDSRQNSQGYVPVAWLLYCALFWIQGKTCELECRVSSTLYCALFWIQGKTYVYFLSDM